MSLSTLAPEKSICSGLVRDATTSELAIERGDGLLFHLIALPVEDKVLEDGDGRRAHGFSFLPWGGSVAVPLAVYKYSRPAY